MTQNFLKRIERARESALSFPDKLRTINGFKYTINHDVEKYPAALLYGTWSIGYLKHLLLGNQWKDEEEKIFILNTLNSYRTSDGLYFPTALDSINFTKSREYMLLHCYNYSVGAALLIDPNTDFQSKYMDHYLEADNLQRWLNQRSLARPWEEANNIVNVASYLALCNDNGQSKGKERLYEMLEWHNKHQNPKTGGFEFFSASRGNLHQSMAGSVHNFHIHHYLDEPMNYEKVIGNNVTQFLFEGPLTACLSIDFVELACYVLPYVDNPYELEQGLLYHLNALLNYQNGDGGFFENESASLPTTANGMKETIASSNSYSAWFRMCSVGMIATALFGDSWDDWNFRNTLGMGYYKKKFDYQPKSTAIDKAVSRKYYKKNLPAKVKTQLKQIGVRLIG